MKNLKNKVFCILILFLVSSQIHANDFFHISVEQIFGVKYGTFSEFVFSEYKTREYSKLSELNWHIKPAFYLGGKATFSYKIFDFSFYGAGFFSNRTGTMEDSDWLSESNKNMKTTYSISENTLNDGSFFGTDFSSSFKVFSWFNIVPKLSLTYEKYNFSAKNGYGWYGHKTEKHPTTVAWDDENAVFYAKGSLQGVDYTRNNFYIWIGASTLFKPCNFLQTSLGFYTSAFTYINSIDHHHSSTNSGTYYYDSMYGFFKGLTFDASVQFILNQFFSIKLNSDYSIINLIKGKCYYSTKEEGPFYSIKADSGADSKTWNWSISVCYKPV